MQVGRTEGFMEDAFHEAKKKKKKVRVPQVPPSHKAKVGIQF